METNQILLGDNLELMRAIPDGAVDLVFGSPPYEKARTYGIGFSLSGEAWVEWMFDRIEQMVRVSKGLVCIVAEGQTKDFRYSAAPILLMADLHRAGYNLRKPAIFHRVGIPGSGGPDWLRNDYEFCICVTRPGKLPWSDNKAMGHAAKWAPGGPMSNRKTDGTRVNGRDDMGFNSHGGGGRKQDGSKKEPRKIDRTFPVRREDGSFEVQGYTVPSRVNPGNTVKETYTADEVASLLAEASDVTHHIVGGGVMGSRLCHENEAPFPDTLAEFFIRSFCPPGGIVLDPFAGSGTTLSVAEKHGRRWLGIDVRPSQVELSQRRIQEAA